jgi:protein TonB
MEKTAILSADLLDILFDGKNKTYGAYDLRKHYSRRLHLAMAATVFVCLIFIGVSLLASTKKNKAGEMVIANIELENFKKEEPKPEQPKPIEQKEQKIQTQQYVVPKIVEDDQMKPEEEVPDETLLVNTKIGTITQEGIQSDAIAPPVETALPAAEAPKKEEDINTICTVVQIPASFEGGAQAWQKYLQRNLNSDLPAENGAPAASYTVTVSFIVDRTGAISDVRAENDPGYGTSAEAVRVIQKSPHWKPAIQNGREVIYRHKQNITFRIGEQ